MPSTRSRHRQRGAALLIAMLILTLVATAASAMVWHQQRAIELEAAERARLQAYAMLAGSLDSAAFFIRNLGPGTAFVNGNGIGQDFRDVRLSSLLAADRDNNADGALEAYFSGQISDAQDRYNLRRLFGDDGKVVEIELAALRRLCDAAGIGADVAERLANGLGATWFGADEATPLAPARVEQLRWLGFDDLTVEALAPFVTILPGRTPVNANNAPAPVLMAAIDGLDLANAQRLVRSRPPQGWTNVAALRSELPEDSTTDDTRVGVQTRFFDVRGSVRLEDRRLELRWLVESRSSGRGREAVVLRREHSSHLEVPR